MTYSVANTSIANTFNEWRTRTNELAYAMSTLAVTIESNTADGNAAITGTFTANDFIAQTNLTVGNAIIHDGDTDTYILFNTDTAILYTGNSIRLHANNSGISFGSNGVKVSVILDEANLSSNSNTALATQSSIKSYVDSGLASLTTLSSNVQTFSANGTWTKPDNAVLVYAQLWAGGGSGGLHTSNEVGAGGGGGEYENWWFDASELSNTESVVVGPGGASTTGTTGSGNAGGNSTFSTLTVIGGDGGNSGADSGTVLGGDGGSFKSGYENSAEASISTDPNGIYSGGGGSTSVTTELSGGDSKYGGAGGESIGASGSGAGPGVSKFGGDGGQGGQGTNGSPGSAPGGGGGGAQNATGSSGAGGDGKVIITTILG